MRWALAAALGLLGFAAWGAERPERHFLAVSATSYNPTTGDPPGQILLYDRDTARPFARFDFAGQASAPAITADGRGLYVVAPPGIGVIDLTTLAPPSMLPVQAGGFTLADDRILLHGGSNITAVDLAATRVLATVPCPAPTQTVVYNGVTGYAYATMVGRQDLCVATPDLDPAAPLPTPVAARQTIDTAVMLDDGTLLLTTYDAGAYKTFAMDLANGRSAAVPSLDGVYPSSAADGVLFGFATDGFRAYRVSLGPDGMPVFTAPAPVPQFADDRYVYAGVPGSCSTLEGPVACVVGFRMLDPASGAEVHSVVLAGRGVTLTVSAPMPFGSSASPPRRSRR